MAPTKAETLRNKRQAFINQLTRLNEFVQNNAANAAIEELKIRMDALDRIQSQFEGVQGKIEEGTCDADTERVRTDFENIFYQIHPRLSRLIRERSDGQPPALPAPVVAPVAGRQRLRLPELAVTKFAGDTTKWLSFIESFMSLVDRDGTLSNSAKFQYLIMSVTGPAAKIIESIELNDVNYPVALGLLRERYDNRTLITQEHIKQLFSLKAVERNSSSDLRNLIDSTRAHIRALQTLGRPVQQWDDIIIYLITSKLDFQSLTKWQQDAPTDRHPILTDLLSCLSHRCLVLENTAQSVSPSTSTCKSSSNSKKHDQEKKRTSLVTSASETCIFCDSSKHVIYRCDQFRKMAPSNRLAEIKRLQACINCLRLGHSCSKCTTQSTCRVCFGQHHSLLHLNVGANKDKPSPSGTPFSAPNSSAGSEQRGCESNRNVNTSCNVTALPANPVIGESKNNHVFLATAMTVASNKWGQTLPCRVLLDSASQLNFITEKLAHQLRLQRERSKVDLFGVGGIETAAKHITFLTIKSRINDFSLPIEAYILPQITGCQPDRFIDVAKVGVPEKMLLADPKFNAPQKIDLLIGSEHFFALLTIGQFSTIDNLLFTNTVFGWVVSGKTSGTPLTHVTPLSSCVATRALVPLDKQVQQFWELEETTKVRPTFSDEEAECVRHFNRNLSRSSDGRYIVRLPFRRSPNDLGNSQLIATQRFYNLERKFYKQPELKIEYTEFINDYLRLGHMQQIDTASLPENHYFMPHHCVLKPDSTSTRLRVVFDASAKSTTGNSLNDLLMVGPTVQSDIFSIILRFRFWRFVFISDIAKMYRQILVADQDTIFQCIVWRNKPEEELRLYRLKTVTYGTSSAPFLATQTLNQLSSDYEDEFPGASQIIKTDCYVDDIMTGSNSLQEAIRLQEQVISLLRRGGFELKKWCANHRSLLDHLQPEDLVPRFRFRDNDAVKTLGLIWEPTSDQFVISVDIKLPRRITKRTILADTMKVFDPLGLVAPIVVAAKIFLQHLWKLNLAWDDILSQELQNQWLEFRNQLSFLPNIKFDRHILLENAVDIQLHAFADASEKAFGSVVYVRSTDRHGNIKTALLCSKSRVAPTKSTTLPKLELCAAQLTAELVSRILECYKQITNVYYWTDSTVTLAWIAAPAYKWKTFVSNRVANIQELSDPTRWAHVPTEQNPADLTSRGMNARLLIESDLWFNGPKFLTDSSDWPTKFTPTSEDIPERKIQRASLIASAGKQDLIANIKFCQSFQMTVRVIAHCQRFAHNTRARISNTPIDASGTFDADQLDAATAACVRCIQHDHFTQEIADLNKRGKVKCRSSIRSLNPFLDENQILRVGGRLQRAEIPYNAKHPMILPKLHPFTSAMIQHYHRKHFHAGPQSLLASVRQMFWPIHGKELVKKIVRKCVRCTRAKPILMKQLMGNLPYDRLHPERPFTNVGIDFMGPFYIHYKIRGKKPTKAYAAIFICFWSRAVHIEVVSDLTTEAFLAALKRFVGRRGLPQKIYSDNATNFVGTKNELAELKELFMKQSAQAEIKTMCANDGINWCTIPPRSPHFGGLWEAAVKAAKFHLKRQFALASLTFEELTTAMVQVEAIMNSRPMIPLSADPDDFDALTAGHFLVGGPLTAPLEPTSSVKNIGLVKRWHRIRWLQQQFWQWWVKEYMHQLQDRQKWTEVSSNLKLNSLVLLQDDNLPPLKWLLGRVIEVQPGDDELVRVATVKTATGVFKRAITRLAVLSPTIDEDDTDSVR